ncbi:MAG: hypothetical protein ABIJ97_13690 [Bacteroidota bacterium]
MIRMVGIALLLLVNQILLAINDTLLIVSVSEVNTQYDDYAPSFIDSNIMIFTSSQPNLIAEKVMVNNHNLFISKKENENWNTPKFISYQANSDNHETSAGISADRKILFIYKSFYGGDLYSSDIDGLILSPPKKLHINTLYHESSACLCNGNLFFVSDRPGGKGGHDIYYCTQNENGKLSEPLNLEVLNSDQDENYLYITDDGSTLYFSSKGHNSTGGYDIFKSIKKTDGQWSSPESIGALINTIYDEICFTQDISGKIYFSSDRPDENNKGYNIYACIEIKTQVIIPDVVAVDSINDDEIDELNINTLTEIDADININRDTTNIITIETFVLDKSLEEIKEKIGFEVKYCRVQVGAFSTIESITEFAKRFPLLGDKVIMINNKKYNRFLMRETFESIDSAAVLQQKCLKEYHSVPDTFIGVYDGFGKRVIIYFDLEKNSYLMLPPEQQNTDESYY